MGTGWRRERDSPGIREGLGLGGEREAEFILVVGRKCVRELIVERHTAERGGKKGSVAKYYYFWICFADISKILAEPANFCAKTSN